MKRPSVPQSGRSTPAAQATPRPSRAVAAPTGNGSTAAARPARVEKPARSSKVVDSDRPTKPTKPARPAKAADPAREARREIRQARRRRTAELRAERRRFTANRRRRRWFALAGVGVVVLLFLAVLGVAYSPLMAVRTITVEGTSSLDPTAVEAALAGQIGTPLPLINTDQIRQELSAFPAVQSFVTEAHPPSTLIVRIVERTPIGVFSSNGQFATVDTAGVVMANAAKQPSGLPLLQVPSIDSAAFRTIGSVLLALPADMRATLSQAGASSTVDAWFQISGGPKVIWGDASEPVLKLKVLQALLAAAGGVSEINVSAPDSPFTR